MVMPRKAHTNIGDSETPGGMRVYCSASARTDNSQGLFPNDFWKKVTFKSGTGKKGKKYVQRKSQSYSPRSNSDTANRLTISVTGRIKKGFSQLNDNDGGGQYDSSGGAGGQGNPKGSKCAG
jgi:hypothetical protein